MQGGNESGGTIAKMPGSTRVIALFDQDGFEGQHLPVNDVGMDWIEHPALATITDQHHQATLWSHYSEQPTNSSLEPIEILRDRGGRGEIVGMVAIVEARPIRGMPEYQVELPIGQDTG